MDQDRAQPIPASPLAPSSAQPSLSNSDTGISANVGPNDSASLSESEIDALLAEEEAGKPTHSGLVDVIPESIDRSDPVAKRVCELFDADMRAAELEIPRLPHVAAPILEFVNNPRVSNQEVIRYIRMDPVLSGRILETANSAVFAGSQPISNLQMAILRLGLRKVSEIALEMSNEMKVYHGRKRGALLDRLWKFSIGTAFACESLAQFGPRDAREGAFLTGLFHAVASPAIVGAVGRLERRTGGIPTQSDERVLGLMNLLSTDLSLRVLESWYLPKEIQDAIRLQDGSARDRRGKPLAHLLACGKLLAAEMGIGVRSQSIDLRKSRDFWYLRIDDRKTLDEATGMVRLGMDGLPKV